MRIPNVDTCSLLRDLAFLADDELLRNLTESVQILQSATEAGQHHWVLAFSGGKDSSAVVLLVVELLKRQIIIDVTVDIVYSDTLMELPPLAENAANLLSYVSELSSEYRLPVNTHTAVAPIERRFWFLVLGKGYPPPHNHFRWCTDRLKIVPTRQVLAQVINEGSVVLTGVRMDESDSRNGRLRAAMCSKDDSECGQGVWINGSPELGIPGLAPIVHWRTCKVWDFLMAADSLWEWPFENLSRMYGDSAATRFGCWMCTLVREDKALISLTRQPEWRQLCELTTIRSKILEQGRLERNRIRKPNGELGRTALAFREQVLADLLTLQEKVGVPLIEPEEVLAIQAYWEVERSVPDPYRAECKYWKWQGQYAEA